MNPPDLATGPVAGSVTDLLRRTYGMLAGRLDGSASIDTAVDAALLVTVEAAVSLAELREEFCAGFLDDPESRAARLREVYLCTRAAAVAARFAVVGADDQRRAGGAQAKGKPRDQS